MYQQFAWEGAHPLVAPNLFLNCGLPLLLNTLYTVSHSTFLSFIIYPTDIILNVREQVTEHEKDGTLVILEWDNIIPLYSINVSVIPEIQVNISGSMAKLKVIYNIMYNVSVIVSLPCGQNSVTVFTQLYYYTSPRE